MIFIFYYTIIDNFILITNGFHGDIVRQQKGKLSNTELARTTRREKYYSCAIILTTDACCGSDFEGQMARHTFIHTRAP
jgi:hypothetical protein